MKVTISTKSGTYERPYLRKGYYPARLVSITPYKDKEQNWVEGKYGRQLIFEYALYRPGEDGRTPIAPAKYKVKDGSEKDVLLSTFIYHQYKDAKTGEYYPAPALAKHLARHGFVSEGNEGKEVELDDFIGIWVELNIDDYRKTPQDEPVSSVKDVGKYEGGAIPPSLVLVESSRKQMQNAPVTVHEKIILTDKGKELILDFEKRIDQLTAMYSQGTLSKTGLEMGIKSLKERMEDVYREERVQ